MLNAIWLVLIVAGVVVGGFLGTLAGDEGVVQGAFDMAKFAVVNLAIPLGAIMILWLGLMRLAEASGLISVLARLIRPVMRRLFPDVPADHPAMGSMILNMAANMLGLGNAATPLGLKAMAQLQEINPRKDTASNAMCTFLAINTSSVTLIPATAVGLLAAAGVPDPYAIVGTAVMATTVSTIVAIVAVKVFERLPAFAPDRAGAAGGASGVEARDAGSADPTAAPGGRRIGRGGWLLVGGVLLAFAVIFVFELAPGVRERFLESSGLQSVLDEAQVRREAAAAIESGAHEDPGLMPGWKRVVNAISVISIPFVMVFFVVFAAVRGVRVYEEFVEGAKEGFSVALRIMPFLVAMLVAMGIFRDSGALLLISWAIGPVLEFVGFPVDLLPMALMRPLSGGGAQGILGEILANGDLGNAIKYTAATMYGSTETTFYVLAVYFGSVGIRRTRHALAAGLLADLAGVIAAVVICRAFFGA